MLSTTNTRKDPFPHCWKEAVATELQEQCPMPVFAASDPDGGAESVEVSVHSIDVFVLSTFRRQVLGHDRLQK